MMKIELSYREKEIGGRKKGREEEGT